MSDSWFPATNSSDYELVPTGTDANELGVRGWLALFILGLTIAEPARMIIRIDNLFQKSGLTRGTALEAAITLLLICFGIYAGVRLWKIKPKAVRLAKWYLVALVIYSVLVLLANLGAISPPTKGQIDTQEIGKEIGTAIGWMVFAIVWYSYLGNSKRVAATYLVP